MLSLPIDPTGYDRSDSGGPLIFADALGRPDVSVEVLRQVKVPVFFDGVRLDADLRLDLLVEDCVIVEVKAVERMIPLYDAQCLTYLKLTGHRLCLLINFNVPLIKDGIKRIVL